MPVIIISRGSYYKGKEVAEKVAKKLEYDCISREVLLQAAKDFDVPEIKLERAIHDAPSILDRFANGRKRYLAYIRSAFLDSVQKDNVVYHGMAGHFLVKDVSHVLKVRVIAEMEDRVRLEMARRSLSREKALALLNNDDQERLKWSQHLYGMDPTDPTLFDLVIRIKKIDIEDAVEIICAMVGREEFQITPASRRFMDDLTVAARVEAALIDMKPDVHATSEAGTVRIALGHVSPEELAHLRYVAERVPGVNEVFME